MSAAIAAISRLKKPAKKALGKSLTIDDIAAQTQQGFEIIHTNMKKGFTEIDEKFVTVHLRFDAIDTRLDRIEFPLIGAHDRRIEKTEDDIRKIKTLLETKLAASFS